VEPFGKLLFRKRSDQMIMFEEIPSPPAPPSQRAAIAGFAVFFSSFLISSAIAWWRWSGPMSLGRKIAAAEFIVGSLLSGAFLLTAKSTTPEGNRKRLTGLFVTVLVLQVIVSVLE
jgi:hypothetical protein